MTTIAAILFPCAVIFFLRHVDGIHFAASCWLTVIAMVSDFALWSS